MTIKHDAATGTAPDLADRIASCLLEEWSIGGWQAMRLFRS